MSIRILLNQLKESDIHIKIENNKFKLDAPEGKLTPALIEKIKNRKQEIIDFLQKNVQSQMDYTSIEPAEEKEYYALSSAQKRMYFLQRLDLESAVYNMLNVIPIQEDADLAMLENTFKKLIKRHESLRTSFEIVQENLVQVIHREVDFNIKFYDGITDFSHPFKLSQAPLLRVGVIDPGTGGRLLAVDMHHIISDGISETILTRDFISLYNGEQLPPLRLQYKDYAEWHNRIVQSEAYKKQETYWLNEFFGEIPVLELATDFPRPSFQSFEGSSILFEIPSKETKLLKEMALEKEFTLYMILLSLLTILLSKLSGQEDIIIGTPVAGRTHADLQGIIGMFINTLPMRNQPTGEKTGESFLHEVKQHVLEGFKNQDYQFEDLVEKVALNRDAVRNPLFDVMFAWHNIKESAVKEFPNNEVTSIQHEKREKIRAENKKKGVARFDMSWAAMEIGNQLVFSVEFCTRLFKEATIYKFINYFKQIISYIVENLRNRISELEILSPDERREILINFNNTRTQYPKEKTIHQLFEEQAEATPDFVVIMEGSEDNTHNRNGRIAVTYKEITHRAGYLANLLRKKGLKKDHIAGIMMERSIQMIIAMLAILKNGGAYLPFDFKYPVERIKYMLEDSKATLLLTQPEFFEKFEELTVTCKEHISDISNIFFHNDCQNHLYEEKNIAITVPDQPAYVAYVMYTSGSTGKPKGVMVEHQSVVRLLKNNNFIHWIKGDRLLATGGIAFDISTFEIWSPLLNTATLFLIEEKIILHAGKLAKIMNENNITILHLVPQLFNQLFSQSVEIFASLRYFLIGGDLVNSSQVNELIIRNFHLEILHMYGPTENTTFSTFLPVKEFYKGTIPIGKPIGNSTVYVVDKYHKLVPMGVPGELIVGGDGIARGYLNRPELTAEKFNQDLWDKKDNQDKCDALRANFHHSKLYRTGDLGRWLSDGNIEFMGRIDSQVKIRGQRIEIGEIESQILKYAGIKEVVVMARENNGDKFLCAYFVPINEIEIPALKGYLSQRLPDYMIPAYFIPMDNLPLTSTGKVDRKVLPIPGIRSSKNYIPPGNTRQEILCKIWSQVLGIEKEKIGIDDNFFEIGGNSLNLIMLVGKIDKELSIEMPISQIYHYPTIRDIDKSLVSKNLSDQPVSLLNRLHPRKIFCFPDQFGWGYCYGSLASLLEDYSVYSLIYLEDEDRLVKYVDLIKTIQPVGPYVFFGHSAAGRLTFEVARALEDQSCEVSDIIFADCFFSEKLELDVKKEAMKILPFVEEFVAEWNAEFLKGKIMKKLMNYMSYLVREIKLEIINANVHLIISDELKDNKKIDPHCWDKLTTKPTRIYDGFGRHVDMLIGKNLEKNIKIINKILDGIAFEN